MDQILNCGKLVRKNKNGIANFSNGNSLITTTFLGMKSLQNYNKNSGVSTNKILQ
jgi:hypothetical protein